MIEIKAPATTDPGLNRTVFLAGSTEMGTAENWQDEIVKNFKNSDIVFYNPRRDDWDSSWKQSIDNRQFNEQVTWELSHIESAGKVIFYFDGDSKSPITLMELGYVLGRRENNKDIFVYCPDNFYRNGNVDIICAKNGIRVFNDKELFMIELKQFL